MPWTPVSPILISLYIEEVESRALSSFKGNLGDTIYAIYDHLEKASPNGRGD